VSARAVCEGVVTSTPREGRGVSGVPYATAGVRCKVDNPRSGEPDSFQLQVLAFNQAADALLALSVGDPVTVSGPIKINIYDSPTGVTGGLGMIANEVTAVSSERSPQRKPRRHNRQTRPDFKRAAGGDFDDPLTF
jgi:hypothetical protein